MRDAERGLTERRRAVILPTVKALLLIALATLLSGCINRGDIRIRPCPLRTPVFYFPVKTVPIAPISPDQAASFKDALAEIELGEHNVNHHSQ